MVDLERLPSGPGYIPAVHRPRAVGRYMGMEGIQTGFARRFLDRFPRIVVEK